MQTKNIAGKTTFAQYAVAIGLFMTAACGATEPHQGVTPAESNAMIGLDIGYPIAESTDNRGGVMRESAPLRRWLDYRQIDRRSFQDFYRFPNFRHSTSDQYTETRTTPPLDILLVVDDSSSMGEEQRNLAARLDPLLSFVQGSDWQIHVVTTTTSCPTATTPEMTIRRGDTDINTKFAAAVNRGTGGDINEMGIKMARESLETPCRGVTWLRSDSALAILIISDEDNCSDGRGCGSSLWSTDAYLYDYLSAIRQPGTTARVYGLIWAPTMGACTTSFQRAPIYANIIRRTGGIAGSICDTDYTATLRAVSADAATLLPPTVTLSQIPVNDQVVVTVDGVTLAPSEYSVQGRNLYLVHPLGTGQHLEVSYQYDDVYSRIFPLSNAAAPDSVRVESAGTSFAPTDFSYDQIAHTVTMIAAVSPNQEILVNYKENIPLRTTFFMGAITDPSSIQCFLNDGTELHDFIYDAAQSSIIFSVPPTERQLFKCSFVR